MFKLKFFILSIVLAFVLQSTTFAQLILPPNAVGKVTVYSKPVTVIHNGKSKTVGSFGLVLMGGDLVKTGKSGKAKIVLATGDEFFVASSSSLRVSSMATKAAKVKKQKRRFNSFFLSAIGKIRAKIKKLKKRKVEIRTANAVIGVKGTEFIVEYKDGQTTVGTLEGLVNMESSSTKKSIDIPPGKMTSVSPTGEVMSLQDIVGELMEGVEFAGEQMKEDDFSGARIEM